MVVVDADGEIITAANGHVSSDNPELVKQVKYHVALRRRVQLTSRGQGITATLNPSDPLGITAALFSARPGRTILLEAPEEVTTWIEKEREKTAEWGTTESLSPQEIEQKFLAASNENAKELLIDDQAKEDV